MTDNAPELSGLRERSGNEPELSGAREKCPDCGKSMRRTATGNWNCVDWDCLRAQAKADARGVSRRRLRSDPHWFSVGKTTPEQQLRNVRAGRHPLGSPLATENRVNMEKRCGNCQHLYEHRVGGTYFKCTAHKMTHGPASDVRKKWPACDKWVDDPDRL
jgi:hypothetical protein